MARCPGCNTNLSCGCNLRTASDGTSRCTNCVAAYEQRINIGKKIGNYSQDPKIVDPTIPILPGQSYQHNFIQQTAPSGITVSVKQE